jgi:magnesium chelatase family protein
MLRSAAVFGVEAYPVDIEVDVSFGLPHFGMVGLPDATVRESRDRVRSAIRNSGFDFPRHRITVNLAPADVRKAGSSFDLPIALGLLAVSGSLNRPSVTDTVVVGELSLDGGINSIRGVLPIAIAARRLGLKRLLLPPQNVAEACVVEGLEVCQARSLPEAVDALNRPDEARLARPAPASTVPAPREDGDLSDVRGQLFARRALEVAAAGGHNLLLSGPPGAGKTMMARRLGSILPPLTFDEALECTAIHSVAGTLPPGVGLLMQRPFRAPHHTISNVALVGGGAVPRPGEISLAHNGVLFLDEMPEFDRRVLEVLRQPLEEGRVTIARAARTAVFPARFVLIAAMNPCPCGFSGDDRRQCRCTPAQVAQYRARLSGPLRDRIDLIVEVPAVPVAAIAESAPGENSAAVRRRVCAARERQLSRLPETRARTNAELRGRFNTQVCRPDAAGHELLKRAVERFGLSARGYDRVVKVARTIADLHDCDRIAANHVAEALQYRGVE